MAKCPKCGIELNPNTEKCPNCQTIISISRDEEIIELPKLKEELPKEKVVVKEEIEVLSLEETQPLSKPTPKKEIVVKPIPLKVKAPESHPISKKEEKEELPKLNNKNTIKEVLTNLKFESTLKIGIVSVLLILNILLISNIVIQIDNTNPVVTAKFDDSSMKVIKETTGLPGVWITQNNGLFKFQEDNHFYWYDNSLVLDDNYFGGTFTYKQGLEAIEEMGYTEETFRIEVDDVIDVNNVYSLELTPLFSYKNKKDNTSNDIKEKEKWWFLIIINEDDTAFAYNQTLDLRYNLTKANK